MPGAVPATNTAETRNCWRARSMSVVNDAEGGEHMEDLAKTAVRKLPFIPPRVNALNAADDLGRVLRRDGTGWLIRTRMTELVARRAASCLLDPAVDDLVLITGTDDGRNYILAVLERARPAVMRITLDANTALIAEHGTLSVRANGGIRLLSDGPIGVIGRSLHLMADEGTLIVQSLSLLSKLVRIDASKASLVANVVESIADRLHCRARRIVQH
jgi:hypothetical protein